MKKPPLRLRSAKVPLTIFSMPVRLRRVDPAHDFDAQALRRIFNQTLNNGRFDHGSLFPAIRFGKRLTSKLLGLVAEPATTILSDVAQPLL